MAAKKRNLSERWAVVRIPRALLVRIREGQGTTIHETITRAMNAREDPKADRRVREMRAELAKLQRLYEGALAMLDQTRGDLERSRADVAAMAAMSKAKTSAADRTLPLPLTMKGGRS